MSLLAESTFATDPLLVVISASACGSGFSPTIYSIIVRDRLIAMIKASYISPVSE